MKSAHIQHLYNRVGFGITPKELKKLRSTSKKKIIKMLFAESKKTTPLEIDLSFYNNYSREDLKNEVTKRELRKMSNQKVREYNLAWLNRLSKPNELLREKMTLFWANHFVCESREARFAQQYNNCLRKHALGHFGDFTKAISKEPAMLIYLNNKQNVKASPNENFARELMELFTLGRKVYGETDVKQAARAFTGYFHDRDGNFFLRKRFHDEGQKYFLAQSGNFSGDDIIDIILTQKQCAQFICEKVYRYFVNDTINPTHLEEMTEVFYQNYNIKKLMHFVVSSDWFYDEENIGTKIKSPIEFLMGIQTSIPYTINEPQKLIRVQRLLGQILLYPPNVAGWKTGKYWIDSNTIVTRLQIPSLLFNNRQIPYSVFDDEGNMMNTFGKQQKNKKSYLKAVVDWNHFDEHYKNCDFNDLIAYILNGKINKGTQEILLEKQAISKREFCIQLMSLPEYQLC